MCQAGRNRLTHEEHRYDRDTDGNVGEGCEVAGLTWATAKEAKA
jgi:hypothetical protein